MSDHSPIDESLVSFNQQQSSPTVTTPTKQKNTDFFENFASKDIDPFGNHNGNGTNTQEYHSSNGTNKDEHHNGTNGTNGTKHDDFHQFSLNNDHFPVDTNENEKGKLALKKKTRRVNIYFYFLKFLLMIIKLIIIMNFQHVKMKNLKIHL